MVRGSERHFQQQVLNLATLYDWSAYFTHRSDRSPAGYPDLTLVRDESLIFAELKTDKGRVRPEQTRWLNLLERVPGVETYLWRPADWPIIQQRLARGRHQLKAVA